MKKGLWLILIVFLAGAAFGIDGGVIPSGSQQENLSLKAGPTEPGEGLSLVWVEAMVYPKIIKDEKVISLGVRTASKVKEVKAFFDFNSEKVVLASSDGMFWSNIYRIPAKISSGVHVVRYQIGGAKGNIQRTVEFYINSQIALAGNIPVSPKPSVVAISSWPITVTSTCAALTGTSSRIIQSGQKLTALSKVPWYKVVFDDGSEGWISSTRVKEPTEDYYNAGYKAYKAGNYAEAIKNYQNTVTVDPEFVKGYLWLAKSYMAQDNLDAASEALQKALKLDERDMDSRVLATNLAQKFYSFGHAQFKSNNYNEAVANFKKALDLKPSSVLSWIEMGQSLSKLGFEAESRNAWKEALKYEPENKELHSLLKTDYQPAVAAKPVKEVPSPLEAAVSPLLSKDSLDILKSEKTKKGTALEKAIRSVIAMTRSLGTPIAEKGWQIKKQGEKFLVSYLCQQSGGVLESFDWLVDVDSRQVLPHNDNARLLMSRW